MVRLLRPLAIAANITQSSFCRIDDVLITFGYLTMHYSAMDDHEDQVGRDSILASIERRWAKTDQEIFIAAVILNPFYQSTPFACLSFLTNAGIHAMLERLWIRFEGSTSHEPVPPEFHNQVSQYLARSGHFEGLQKQCEIAQLSAEREVRSFSTSCQSHPYELCC